MLVCDHLEHAIDASELVPSTWKQENKAYVQLLLCDKETSRNHEYNLNSVNTAPV